MHFTIARRVQQVVPSKTLAIAAKAGQMKAAGKDIINLSIGEPDFDTPSVVKEAAIDAINKGFTKYTAVDGILELKQAVKAKFAKDNSLYYELNQILISSGAKQTIYNLCQAVLNPEDEVLIPAPFWVSYPDIVLLAGGRPVIIPTSSQTNFKITALQLSEAITPKTKLIILNSPSNPTGIVYNADELRALGAVLKKHPQILIATDDIYEYIFWSQPFVNIVNACSELYERTIVINGVSKAYAMTGWRIGYAGGPVEIIKAMSTIQSQSTSNPCSISQKAAVSALSLGRESVEYMVLAFKERHDFVVSQLKDLTGVEIIPADGTFYIFPNFQNIITRLGFNNDLEFSEKLLQEEGVAIVPGSAFGNEGCIRISFATDLNNLEKALTRIGRFCK